MMSTIQRLIRDPSTLRRGACLWAVLALTLAVYLPSLGASFIGDDPPNLSSLNRVSGLFTLEFWVYTTTGIAGPTGRPLSLLSFALQHWGWPDSPATFRWANIMLHLLIGCAIALLTLRLARRWRPAEPARAEWLAIGATALWLLHPIQVSTVVYIVQRMTQLTTLFTVLGLLAWVHGRERVALVPERWSGYLWAAFGIGAGGLLAVLSKETGVLILAYALVLEHTVYGAEPMPSRWRQARHLLLHLPAAAFVALVALRFDKLIMAKYAIRDFSL